MRLQLGYVPLCDAAPLIVAHAFGWQAVFLLGAALTAVGAALLWHELPVLQPAVEMRYPQLLSSVLALLRERAPDAATMSAVAIALDTARATIADLRRPAAAD